jgi:hypothetical protein
VHQIQIDSWQLGYYEYSCKVSQTTIRPVYIFDCTIIESPPTVTPPITSRDRIHVWAEALPPQGQILSPPDGTCVPPSSQVCFNGSGTGGVSPLTYEWRDDTVGQLLGTGPSLCAVLPAFPAGHVSGDSMHTVTLTVRDALGREGHAAVEICVAASSGAPEARPQQLFIHSVLPNPTLGSVRVHFAWPKAGELGLDVFDLAGRRLRTLEAMPLEAGSHTIEWDGRADDGRQVSSGVYFIRLAGAGVSARRQVVVVR